MAIVLFCAKTFFTPPDISLPMVIAPHRPRNRLCSMTTFAHGTPTRRPSTSRPDLMTTPSSPVSNVQPVTCTSVHASGSQPSTVAPRENTLTLLIVTLVHSTGCRFHIAELRRCTPSINTLVQR